MLEWLNRDGVLGRDKRGEETSLSPFIVEAEEKALNEFSSRMLAAVGVI